jgi:fatty acid desaturase
LRRYNESVIGQPDPHSTEKAQPAQRRTAKPRDDSRDRRFAILFILAAGLVSLLAIGYAVFRWAMGWPAIPDD